MLKNVAQFVFTIADRVYHFSCDQDSPIEHIKEVIFQLQKAIGQIEDNIKAKQAEQEASKPQDPPPEPEVTNV